MQKRARDFGIQSTVCLIAGLGLIGVGIGAWVFSGSDTAPKALLVVQPSGLALAGSF